ncbi:MAG TPA: hypothetical protein DIV86_07165 [Alphaproteobacteria bacterium]|nr:hypothetical protein [Alphaproteobacteria bacterium]
MLKHIYIVFFTVLLVVMFSFSSAAQDFKPIDITGKDGAGINIADDRISIQESRDDSGRKICYYEEVSGKKYLYINKNLFKTDNILMGIEDPKYCPLPGSDALEGYSKKIQSQFLLSGIVCVVQSIILDSMFRVYCTILLWVFQILYAFVVIYIMFYGLAIMFDLTDEPLRQAPQRFLKVFFILFFAVNAERAFYFVHKGFQNFLDGFSDMLTHIQPYYTDSGQLAYSITEKDSSGKYKILAEDGEVWKSIKPDQDYYVKMPDGTERGPFKTKQGPPDYDVVDPIKYKPYRIPAMQWTLEPRAVNGVKYKLYPVFKEGQGFFAINTGGGGFGGFSIIYTYCPNDYRYIPEKKKLYSIPKCQPDGWQSTVSISPYGEYVSYAFGAIPVYPPMQVDKTTYPTKFKNEPLGNGRGSLKELCDENTPPEECRQPFQSVLGKIDALFNSIVGADRVKSIGSVMMALMLWGVGGGAILGVFLMLGVTTMFIAFMQILWTYVTALMALSFMMMLSPIFISFALFKTTERMFRGWLSNLISYALQPVLVLGFLMVLSSATTLDRLTMLARYEVGDQKYEFTSNSGAEKSQMRAPGFLEPLYEVPPDYKSVFGANIAGRETMSTSAELCNPVIEECGYITKKQREEYIQKKEERLVTAYALMKANNDFNKKPDFQALNRPNNQDLQTALQDSEIAEISDLMRVGINVAAPPYSGKVVKGIKAVEAVGTHQAFVDLYRDEIGIPDGDAFIGEGDPAATDATNTKQLYKQPNWLFCEDPPVPLAPVCDSTRKTNGDTGTGGFPVQQEFPRCVKHCPAFDPPYGVGVAGAPDNFNPTAETCTKFCLHIYENKEEMFAYLMGAVLVWIVLNTLTGAFVSKIPVLAQKLSPFDPRGIAPPKLFGQSQQIDGRMGSGGGGLSGYSSGEQNTSFYGMGTLFDVGLTSGKSGTFIATADKIRRAGSPTLEKVSIDKNGEYSIKTEKRRTFDEMLATSFGSPFNQGEATAALSVKARVYAELKKKESELQSKYKKSVKQIMDEQYKENPTWDSLQAGQKQYDAKAQDILKQIDANLKEKEERKRAEEERKRAEEERKRAGVGDNGHSSVAPKIQSVSEYYSPQEGYASAEPVRRAETFMEPAPSRASDRIKVPALGGGDSPSMNSYAAKGNVSGRQNRATTIDDSPIDNAFQSGGGSPYMSVAAAGPALLMQQMLKDKELMEAFNEGGPEAVEALIKQREQQENKEKEVLAGALPQPEEKKPEDATLPSGGEVTAVVETPKEVVDNVAPEVLPQALAVAAPVPQKVAAKGKKEEKEKKSIFFKHEKPKPKEGEETPKTTEEALRGKYAAAALKKVKGKKTTGETSGETDAPSLTHNSKDLQNRGGGAPPVQNVAKPLTQPVKPLNVVPKNKGKKDEKNPQDNNPEILAEANSKPPETVSRAGLNIEVPAIPEIGNLEEVLKDLSAQAEPLQKEPEKMLSVVLPQKPPSQLNNLVFKPSSKPEAPDNNIKVSVEKSQPADTYENTVSRTNQINIPNVGNIAPEDLAGDETPIKLEDGKIEQGADIPVIGQTISVSEVDIGADKAAQDQEEGAVLNQSEQQYIQNIDIETDADNRVSESVLVAAPTQLTEEVPNNQEVQYQPAIQDASNVLQNQETVLETVPAEVFTAAATVEASVAAVAVPAPQQQAAPTQGVSLSGLVKQDDAPTEAERYMERLNAFKNTGSGGSSSSSGNYQSGINRGVSVGMSSGFTSMAAPAPVETSFINNSLQNGPIENNPPATPQQISNNEAENVVNNTAPNSAQLTVNSSVEVLPNEIKEKVLAGSDASNTSAVSDDITSPVSINNPVPNNSVLETQQNEPSSAIPEMISLKANEADNSGLQEGSYSANRDMARQMVNGPFDGNVDLSKTVINTAKDKLTAKKSVGEPEKSPKNPEKEPLIAEAKEKAAESETKANTGDMTSAEEETKKEKKNFFKKNAHSSADDLPCYCGSGKKYKNCHGKDGGTKYEKEVEEV